MDVHVRLLDDSLTEYKYQEVYTAIMSPFQHVRCVI